MNFTKVMPYGPTSYTYWFSGIYKIVQYNAGEFHAYIIEPGMKNWGNYVEDPPCSVHRGYYTLKYWDSFMSAVETCKYHFANNTEPTHDTIKRATEIYKQELAKENAHQYS